MTLILVLMAMGILLCASLVVGLARMLLQPARMTDGKAMYVLRRLSPGDLGLRFEEMSFNVEDAAGGGRLEMAGWWIPATADEDRCVVLVHGYSDAKVGAIAWAPMLHRLGFHILAIDLRAHGDSEGRYSTAGYFERHDLSQVIDQLRQERPEQTRQIVLFGVSMGAAVAASTATMQDNIAAVVMESPYADFRTAIAARGQSFGVPKSVERAAIRLAERMSGANFDEVRPIDLIPRIPGPLMLIQSGNDCFASEACMSQIAAAAQQRTELTETWKIDDAQHVLGVATDPEMYTARLTAFFSRALQVREPVSQKA